VAGCSNTPGNVQKDGSVIETEDLTGAPAADFATNVDLTGADMTTNADAQVSTDMATSVLCAAATPLTFTSNVATVAGDNTGLTDNDLTVCGGSGPDQRYVFTLTTKQLVTANVTPKSGSSLYAVVALRRICDDITSEFACFKSTTSASASAVLDAGTYYVWVDGYGPSEGAYDLVVTLAAPPPPPTNETCASATALTFTAGVATATGDTTGAADDDQGSCGGRPGGDAVYTFTTTAIQRVNVTVTPDASTPGLKPIVYLRSNCTSAAPADEFGCDTGTVALASLPAGTYAIWVDSDGAGGKYNLKVTLSAPVTNETCTTPTPLTFTGNTATVVVDTTGLVNDVDSNICSGTGPDIVYTLVLAAPKKVTATVTPSGTATTWAPTVSIRTACAVDTSEISCVDGADGKPATVIVNQLAAGTYYIWVDGAFSSEGDGTLTVTLDNPVPPPTNDTCSAPITLVAGTAQTLSTRAAVNDTDSSSCSALGPDVVYTFKLAAAKKVTVTVTPDGTSATWAPSIYIRTQCTTSSTEVDCVDGTAGVAATLVENSLPAGTYFVFVDGHSSTKGDGTVLLTTAAPVPPPANDTCATAATLAAGTSIPVSTRGAAADTDSDGCFAEGPDIVYSFTLAVPKKVTINLTPDGTSTSWTPILYVRTACDTSTSELNCTGAPAGAPASLVFGTLAAGTYYLWVDGRNTSKGDGTLSLTLDTPVAGESCSLPTVLDLSSGSATVAVDTTASGDDGASPTCGGTGPDVVYSYTLATAKNIKIDLTGVSATWNSIIAVRSACTDATSELSCNRATVGASTSLTFPAQAAGTYYLWVDGYSSTKGTGSLTITAN